MDGVDEDPIGRPGSASRDDALDLFLAQAAAVPSQPAIVSRDGALDYAGLARLARGYAAAFCRFAEPRVLVALRRGAAAYAAMFGAGLAGGYYAPVNVDAPPLKLQRIARSLQPDVIVADARLVAMLREAAPAALTLDPSALPSTGAAAEAPAEARPRSAIGYVMFTSGSTGEPKGVVIPRRALDHYVGWMRQTAMYRPDDRVSQYTNIGFDVSVMEIYGALCAGATLFPLEGRGDRWFPAEAIAREQLTVWGSVPSVLSLMMRGGGVTAANFASLRLLNFCGEPLLPEHLAAIFAARPDVGVQNLYGPTETTVSVTSNMLDAGNYRSACRFSAALGPPIPGVGLHLVGGGHADEGELVITGAQLAAGYWRDPARTAELFRDVAIDGVPQRGYFTGDWAERHDGRLFFKERIDFQVKIRGYRVELDEVAAALREIGWPVVCVLGRGDGLVAVVERSAAADFDRRRVIEALALRLESHAIPRAVHLIDHMPRNENGKIDRRAAAAFVAVREAAASVL